MPPFFLPYIGIACDFPLSEGHGGVNEIINVVKALPVFSSITLTEVDTRMTQSQRGTAFKNHSLFNSQN